GCRQVRHTRGPGNRKFRCPMYPGDGPVRETSLLRQSGAGLLPNAQPISAQQSCWGTLKAPLYWSQVPEESLRSILPAFRLPANRLQFAFLEVHDTRAAAPREFQIPASNRIRLLSGAAESPREFRSSKVYFRPWFEIGNSRDHV